MLTKRIIPCLDVKDTKVVKGVQFKGHEVVGDILSLAQAYSDGGADELVFYDIMASSRDKIVDRQWIADIAKKINIPFCVAGGIKTIAHAREILYAGADKISINTPALQNPELIGDLSKEFGQQCVVVGIDSFAKEGDYWVYQYTGDASKMQEANRRTIDWVKQVSDLGAGEIVLNCMNQDGMRQGYDVKQLQTIRAITKLPLIASGGAGQKEHFRDVFTLAKVDGALAASIFHKKEISIESLKNYLRDEDIPIRI